MLYNVCNCCIWTFLNSPCLEVWPLLLGVTQIWPLKSSLSTPSWIHSVLFLAFVSSLKMKKKKQANMIHYLDSLRASLLSDKSKYRLWSQLESDRLDEVSKFTDSSIASDSVLCSLCCSTSCFTSVVSKCLQTGDQLAMLSKDKRFKSIMTCATPAPIRLYISNMFLNI